MSGSPCRTKLPSASSPTSCTTPSTGATMRCRRRRRRAWTRFSRRVAISSSASTSPRWREASWSRRSRCAGRLQPGDLLLFASDVELASDSARPSSSMLPRELAEIVVARGVRAGGKGRETVRLLADDRHQPVHQAALRHDDGDSRPRRLDPPVRLVEGRREPPALQLGQPTMQGPSSLHRFLGQVRSRRDVRNRISPASPSGAPLEPSRRNRRAVWPRLREKLGLEAPDLGAHGRVVELDQQHPLADRALPRPREAPRPPPSRAPGPPGCAAGRRPRRGSGRRCRSSRPRRPPRR